MKRILTLIAALPLALLWSTPSSASNGLAVGNPHVFHTLDYYRSGKAGHGHSSPSLLALRGGSVEVNPAVYISWWGPEWTTGFSTGGYTSAKAQAYVSDFFTNVGGASWTHDDSQYCQGVPSGTTSCSLYSSAQYIANPTGQLKGTWNDTTAVPSSPSQSDIAAAAVRLERKFGYNSNATYIVFTPSGKSESGFQSSWCAWHSSTTDGASNVAFAYMPYQPDAGTSCGLNFVNSANDAYGNGYFDGFSVVGGHEFAEAQTDPYPNSGWLDGRGSETGDKCAWSASSTDITLGSHVYAVQPLWSNATASCVTAY